MKLTKKLISILLVIVMTFSCFSICSFPVFAGELRENGAWPGCGMAQIDGNIYVYYVPEEFNMLIFNDGCIHYSGEHDAFQTGDLSFPGGGMMYIASGSASGKNSYGVKTCGGAWTRYSESSSKDNRLVFFKSPWPGAACYCWNFSDGREDMKKLNPVNSGCYVSATQPTTSGGGDNKPNYPEFKLDPGCSLTIPEFVPLIGGSEVGIDLSLADVKQKNEGNKIKVGIGKTAAEMEDESDWDLNKKLDNYNHAKEQYKTQKENQRKNKTEKKSFAASAGLETSLEGEMAGYIEATLDDNMNIISAEGSLSLSLMATAEVKKQLFVITVPLVFRISGKVGISTEVIAEINKDDARIYLPRITLLLPEISASLGVGIMEVIEASVYGTGSNTVIIDTVNDKIGGILEGEIGVSGRLLGFEAHVALLSGEYKYGDFAELTGDTTDSNHTNTTEKPKDPDEQENPNNPDNPQENNPDGPENPDGPGEPSESEVNDVPQTIIPPVSTNDLSFVFDTDSVNKESKWISGGYTYIGRTKVLQEDLYDGAVPKLVIAGDTIMMVWEANVKGRTAGNNIAVVYSVLDKASGTWSTPRIIDDDGTPDYNPMVATDGNNIFVAWINANKSFTTNLSLENVAKSTDIRLAKYNASNDKFSCVTVANDSNMDYLEGIYAKDGNAYVTWVNNSDNNYLLSTGTNIIKYAKVNSNLSVESHTYKSLVYPLCSATIGDFNGRTLIAYSIDTDKNINTYNDVSIYAGYVGETPIEIANKLTYRSNVQVNKIFGEDTITWAKNGAIYGTTDLVNIDTITDEELDVSSEYSFVTDGYNSVLITVESIEGSSEAVKYSYIDGKWTNPVKITENGKYTSAVSGIFDDNGELLLAYRLTDAVIGEESVDEQSYLCIQNYEEKHNLSLDFCKYDSSSAKPNDKLDIELGISNIGDFYESSAIVTVTNESGNVVYRSSLPIELNSGDSANYKISVPTPTTIDKIEKYEINIDVEGGISNFSLLRSIEMQKPCDCDLSDNNYTITFGYSDLSVSAEEVFSTDGTEHGVRVKVNNYSGVATKAALYIRNNDEFSNRLASYDLGILKPNSTTYFFIDSTEVGYVLEETGDVKFEVVSDFTENDISDNSTLMYLGDFQNTVSPVTPPATEPTDNGPAYIVAGTSNLCSFNWDETAAVNKMTKSGDCYTKTFKNISAANNVMLKVVERPKSGSVIWHGNEYNENIVFNITQKCDVTVEYYPASSKIFVYGNGVSFPQSYDVNSMYVVGNGSGYWLNGSSWNPSFASNKMTRLTNGLYRITFDNISKGNNYQFKFAANGNWNMNWGGTYVKSGYLSTAQLEGSNITFSVPYTLATVSISIDLNHGPGSARFMVSVVEKVNQTVTTPPATTVPVEEPTTLAPVLGDANLDGDFDVMDATTVQKYVASLIVFNEKQEQLADADGNGIVNIKDSTKMLKIIAELDNW